MSFTKNIEIDRANIDKQDSFKYMRLLAMVYVAFLMAATVMAYKLVNIWGITVPIDSIRFIAENHNHPYFNKKFYENRYH